jgi:putative membrane protein insertion efficiency factor
MRFLVVNLILFYQKNAPKRIRQSCRFEPSCSNYMLLAIEKYGLIKGVTKGLKRIWKCKHPNGGVDYP